MKRAYLSGRAIAKVILMEAINGDERYGRYIYRLSSSREATEKEMERLASFRFINAKQLKDYLEKYILF